MLKCLTAKNPSLKFHCIRYICNLFTSLNIREGDIGNGSIWFSFAENKNKMLEPKYL